TCAVSVTFTPSAMGSRSGSLIFTDSATGSPHAVGLAGTGIAPIVSLSGSSVTFANQLVSTTSAAQTVTITNSGTANLTISAAAVGGTNAGDFAKSADTCTGATVTPNSTCTVSVTFTPSAAGSRSASLGFADNASGSPHTVALSGTGIAPAVSLSSSSVTFANQLISTTSAAQTVTVTNSGTANLTISTVTIGGTNAGDFAKGTDTCTGATVTPTNICSVSVTFTPAATGNRSGSLSFADNASGSPHTVAMSGAGIAPAVSLSGSSVTFANQLISTTSAAQTVTVTNSGTANLTISTATIGGTNAGDFAKGTDTCTGATVNPNNTCAVSVTFAPSATGSRSASLSFADNAAGSPHAVAFTGTGQDFSIGMASGSTSTATIARGQAATYSLSMSGLGSLNQTINFTCTGAPSEATCTVNPSSVSSGASGTVALTVTVTTTAASLAPPVLPPAPPFRLDGIGRLGALLLLGLLISASLAGGMKLQRKVFRYGLGIAALMVLALAMAACGGGGGSGGGGYHDSGTPAGTYTLTVMGSASGLQHSTTLTLTVN
ncbi:MAG: choice-of-anchor D domain-containing protein, partial [Acidobacteriota bacterium]|nr:choice-of-anchor D domain-containing protein [Acidobacteriota bacterium]